MCYLNFFLGEFVKFKDLHSQNKPLLLCNVWDAASAKAAQKLNFQAIGTSSAAIAWMMMR